MLLLLLLVLGADTPVLPGWDTDVGTLVVTCPMVCTLVPEGEDVASSPLWPSGDLTWRSLAAIRPLRSLSLSFSGLKGLVWSPELLCIPVAIFVVSITERLAGTKAGAFTFSFDDILGSPSSPSTGLVGGFGGIFGDRAPGE